MIKLVQYANTNERGCKECKDHSGCFTSPLSIKKVLLGKEAQFLLASESEKSADDCAADSASSARADVFPTGPE